MVDISDAIVTTLPAGTPTETEKPAEETDVEPEPIAEETSAEDVKPQSESDAPKQGGNRRHKPRKKPAQGEKPVQPKAEKPVQQKAEQPAQQKPENGEGKKPNNRRHYYRHRRGKPSGDKKPQA